MATETEPVYGTATAYGVLDYPIVIGGSSPSGGSRSGSKTGLKYVNDRYNTAGKLDATVLSDFDLTEGTEFAVTIRDQTLFTGTIRNSKEGVGDRVRVTAYDAVADLKRNHLTASYDRASTEKIARDAIAMAGVDADVQVPTVRVSPEFDEVRCDKVLQKVSKWTDAAWWVDDENTVVVDDDIVLATSFHQLEHIRDTSPGKRTPAYQSVRVTGASPVSRRGLNHRHLISSQPIVATAGEGEPQFTHYDGDIQSQSQAQNVANAIYKRLQAQQRGGWVEVVGREGIRPFDTIEMPDAFGGEEYMVSGVTHRIGDREGFVTRIEIGGLIEP